MKNNSLRRLSLKRGTVSNLRRVNGGFKRVGAQNNSYPLCRSDLCASDGLPCKKD